MQLGRAMRLGIWAAVIISLPVITYIVYLAGGLSRAVSFLYIGPIITAAIFLGDVPGMIVAIAAGVCTLRVPLDVSMARHATLLDTFTRFCIFYGVAILAARLAARWQLRATELSSLVSVGQALGGKLRTDELLQMMARYAAEITRSKGCSILLLNPKDDTLSVKASYGLSPEYLNRYPLPVRASSLDEEALRGSIVSVSNIVTEPRVADQRTMKKEGVASLAIIPLMKNDGPLGVIRVYGAAPRRFTAHERRLLWGFAGQAASAIENAQLYEDIRKNYWETVRALARAIEAKDPYTLGHSERVTRYAVQLALHLGLNEKQVEQVAFGAILHDVGKIGVSEHILDKAERLSISDETLARLHPLIGRSIVAPVEFLRSSSDIVMYHHERFDGKGYPENLVGEDIPYLARLVAVPNVYDQLTSDRPERNGMLPEDAMQVIRDGAGTEFDPEIVAAFDACIKASDIHAAPESQHYPLHDLTGGEPA
jgi:HD-GYP domain-containing protein (c-di-GMP phosphodiesterase class II)